MIVTAVTVSPEYKPDSEALVAKLNPLIGRLHSPSFVLAERTLIDKNEPLISPRRPMKGELAGALEEEA